MKIGMIGLDTSHCPAFADLLHNTQNPHHVAGGRIVAAFPGGSPAFAPSRERVDRFTAQLRDQFQVQILDSIEAVAERADAILLESVDGRQHREQFARLAPFGKPVFIDKPLATTVSDARAILELAARSGTPVFSCSSIRYARGIAELGDGAEPRPAGAADTPASVSGGPNGASKFKVLGCEAFGPAAILPDFPGLFWYGVHSAEVLFAKMGKGCREVVVRKTDVADAAVGTWADGRIGTMYGFRISQVSTFGCTVFTDRGVFQGTAQSQPPYYALLLSRILEFFRSGQSPIDPAETLEITAFLEAANRSRETGEPVAIEL